MHGSPYGINVVFPTVSISTIKLQFTIEPNQHSYKNDRKKKEIEKEKQTFLFFFKLLVFRKSCN